MPCHICLDDRATQESWGGSTVVEVDCPVCGRYRLSHPLETVLRLEVSEGRVNQEERDDLSVAIRHRQPTIVTLTFDSRTELLKERPNWSTPAKLQRLLALLARRWPGLGQEIEFEKQTAQELRTEVAARSLQELDFLMDGLKQNGWFRTTGVVFSELAFSGQITLQGWGQIDPIGGGVPGRCFVAMSFADAMDEPYFSGLRSGIEDAGMDARRVKEIPHTEKICDRILAEIRAATCVIADMSHFRPNVLFEAGYGLALGKPVVFTCQEEHFDLATSHFDTRQYPHLKWVDATDLRTTVRDRLRALGVALKLDS